MIQHRTVRTHVRFSSQKFIYSQLAKVKVLALIGRIPRILLALLPIMGLFSCTGAAPPSAAQAEPASETASHLKIAPLCRDRISTAPSKHEFEVLLQATFARPVSGLDRVMLLDIMCSVQTLECTGFRVHPEDFSRERYYHQGLHETINAWNGEITEWKRNGRTVLAGSSMEIIVSNGQAEIRNLYPPSAATVVCDREPVVF